MTLRRTSFFLRSLPCLTALQIVFFGVYKRTYDNFWTVSVALIASVAVSVLEQVLHGTHVNVNECSPKLGAQLIYRVAPKMAPLFVCLKFIKY